MDSPSASTPKAIPEGCSLQPHSCRKGLNEWNLAYTGTIRSGAFGNTFVDSIARVSGSAYRVGDAVEWRI